MIAHHLTKGESVSKTNDQVILRNPILRQQWELNHDEIEVTRKVGLLFLHIRPSFWFQLGEGAFGEGENVVH